MTGHWGNELDILNLNSPKQRLQFRFVLQIVLVYVHVDVFRALHIWLIDWHSAKVHGLFLIGHKSRLFFKQLMADGIIVTRLEVNIWDSVIVYIYFLTVWKKLVLKMSANFYNVKGCNEQGLGMILLPQTVVGITLMKFRKCFFLNH